MNSPLTPTPAPRDLTRAPRDVFEKAAAQARTDPVVTAILRAVDAYVMVLNEHRQVLAANPEVLNLAGIKTDDLLGARPGDLLQCENAKQGPDGCGTAPACQSCGAAVSIMLSQMRNESIQRECFLVTSLHGRERCLEFRARATPVEVAPHRMIVLMLTDISGQKRREVLERSFLHDLGNIVQGLCARVELAANKQPPVVGEDVVKLSRRIAEELAAHRTLVKAEAGELTVLLRKVTVARLLNELRDTAQAVAPSPTALEFTPLPPPTAALMLNTDAGLVQRILLNMVLNALEAEQQSGGITTVDVRRTDTTVRFSVHNPSAILTDVRRRVFVRSFSTKPGPGRGMGTYTMRLFGETCLGGKVWFTSEETAGTRFHLELPIG